MCNIMTVIMDHESPIEMQGSCKLLQLRYTQTHRKYTQVQTCASTVTHKVNESFSAGWANMLKHTCTYTDPLTHAPCTAFDALLGI